MKIETLYNIGQELYTINDKNELHIAKIYEIHINIESDEKIKETYFARFYDKDNEYITTNQIYGLSDYYPTIDELRERMKYNFSKKTERFEESVNNYLNK